jgi:hypothetical protein
MNNKIYITKDYEKTNTPVDGSFDVDEIIADIIITLNKKGYPTLACCSSHYLEETSFEEPISKKDINKDILLEWLKENDLKYIKEDEENYYYEAKELGRACYIKFDDVTLPNLPEGFELDDNSIYHMIEFYLNNIKKSKDEVELEIQECIDILTEWSNKLPNNNETTI